MRSFRIGSLPLVVNSDVTPPGNHSVRIITSTGAEATVSYTISTGTVTSTAKYRVVWFQLGIHLVGSDLQSVH